MQPCALAVPKWAKTPTMRVRPALYRLLQAVTLCIFLAMIGIVAFGAVELVKLSRCLHRDCGL